MFSKNVRCFFAFWKSLAPKKKQKYYYWWKWEWWEWFCGFESVTEHGIMMTNDLNGRIVFILERSTWTCVKSRYNHTNDVIAGVVADRIQLFFNYLITPTLVYKNIIAWTSSQNAHICFCQILKESHSLIQPKFLSMHAQRTIYCCFCCCLLLFKWLIFVRKEAHFMFVPWKGSFIVSFTDFGSVQIGSVWMLRLWHMNRKYSDNNNTFSCD